MIFEDLIKYFGTAKNAATAINVNRGTYYVWKMRGFIPLKAQLKYESITNGVLKADLEHGKPSEER